VLEHQGLAGLWQQSGQPRREVLGVGWIGQHQLEAALLAASAQAVGAPNPQLFPQPQVLGGPADARHHARIAIHHQHGPRPPADRLEGQDPASSSGIQDRTAREIVPQDVEDRLA